MGSFLTGSMCMVVYFHVSVFFKVAVKKSSNKSDEHIYKKADNPPPGVFSHSLYYWLIESV